MKTALVVVAALTGVALAKPVDRTKRETAFIEDVVTVTVCALGDSVLTEAECQLGIHNGTLRWADESQTQVAVNAVSKTTKPNNSH
jgi:hypothetical protein